jgi:CRISPR-associated endonuclease Csn1
MPVKISDPLTFGLDIGIASVGWAVLTQNRIAALGVRCFDKAETAREGESLNLVRRQARLMRRRLRRRAWRLTKLARLLKREGLIADVNVLKQQPGKGFKTPDLWQIRVDALDRQLADDEWARVLYHLCKHRGFHWISRAEEKKAASDTKGEGGKVKQGLAGTARLMAEKDYRTAAEMVMREFPEAKRNKQGEYSKALSRVLLSREMALLFEKQRDLGNPHANESVQDALLGSGDRKSGLFWAQKPALSGQDLLRMLGHCTFERAEYRAPKASFSAERHVWLTRLNNLRIAVEGEVRALSPAERQAALPLPYQQSGDFTYKQFRAVLVKAGLLPDSFKFMSLRYPTTEQKEEGKVKDPESEKLVKLPAWQEIHKTLKDHGLETEWKSIAGAAQSGNPEVLDQIAWVLSIFKDDEEVQRELGRLALPAAEKTIPALQEIRFDKFSNLSLKALNKILPHMERGLRYDEACEKAGYHHSQLHEAGKGEHKYLPPLYSGRDKTGRMLFNEDMDVPRNPVVLRALNQARKVVNALIRTYGAPSSVHIEMARDLSRPLDERRSIEKEQSEFRERNDKDRSDFATTFNIIGSPKGGDFEKWRLYREQHGKCIYSLKPIELERLLEPGYVEVDHALPYSRSFDDSKNNKVLVLARENRDKGNQTPFEYQGGIGNTERWRNFAAYVEGNKSYRLAKRSRLLRKDFGGKESEGFRERNLNDTRYICRFFKNYVETYLKLAEDSEAKRCVVLSGQLTSLLRARWGLIKIRGDSDRHHALDAAIVAACSHGMVKRMSDYARRKELAQVRDGFVDMETGEIVNPAMFQQLREHFPEPWPHFRDELQTRLYVDDPSRLREEISRLGTYPDEALAELKALFVSRAPQRRNGGAAHKDTVYGQSKRLDKESGVTQKIAVTSLSIKDFCNLIDPHRNERLYTALRIWVEGRDDREKQAKEIEKSARETKRGLTREEKLLIDKLRALPRKPDKNGNPTGPVVRTVTAVIDKLSGIPIRGGIAKNDTMLRVDVFSKDGKFHLVPFYVHHRAKGLPSRAIVAYKVEDEWTVVDDSFRFCFSLHPNDLTRVSLKKESHIGYFAGCDRSTGAISLWAHDRSSLVGKDGLIRGIGVKTAVNLEKFHVDSVGNIYPAPLELRRDVA